MTPTCTQSNPTSTATPVPMVHQDITGTQCQKARMAPDEDSQYQADLAALSRIETQQECFFDVMGSFRHDQVLREKSK